MTTWVVHLISIVSLCLPDCLPQFSPSSGTTIFFNCNTDLGQQSQKVWQFRAFLDISTRSSRIPVGLVHKNHIRRTRLMYHAACKVELPPFKRLHSQLTFFNFLFKPFGLAYALLCHGQCFQFPGANLQWLTSFDSRKRYPLFGWPGPYVGTGCVSYMLGRVWIRSSTVVVVATTSVVFK